MLNSMLNLLDLKTVGVFTAVFLWTAYFLSSKRKLPPGPRGWPIIGNLFLMRSIKPGTRCVFYRQLSEKYGNVCRLKFGVRDMIILSGYETIHEALVTSGDAFCNRPNWLYTIQSATKNGRGIIFANGREWKKLRKMTLISLRDFGVGKLTLEERIRDEVRAVINVFQESSGQPLEMKYFMSRAITNIICSILFGYRFDYDDPKFKELLDALDTYFKMENTSSPLNALPWLRYLPSRKKDVSSIMAPVKIWSDYITEQIERHKETFDDDNIRDFIDVYLRTENSSEDKDIFTVGNIFRLILDLFGAGTETTATTLDWIFLYMIGYPEVQSKCQEEIDRVVGRSRNVMLADRRVLPYVQATINEVQRLANAAPTTIPHGLTRDVVFQGYTLPKHSVVIIDLMSVHMDPNLWNEPDSLRPERFLDKDGNLLNKKTFIPFSEGPRECIGESLARSELFLTVANLLQRYKFSRVNGEQVDLQRGFHGKTLSPKPYRLIATTR